jgi:hypothetical protein
MKHSVEELTVIAYRYFPRGIGGSDPIYQETEEYRRRLDTLAMASSEYEVWRSMLLRIQARFSAPIHPGVMVENLSMFMQSPTAGPVDRAFKAALWLPVRGPTEKHHEISFLISFVVPYYTVYSARHVEHPVPPVEGREMYFEIIGDTYYAYAEQPPGRPDVQKYEAPAVETKREISFELSEEEEPFARGIVEEIKATFPDHELMSPEVGQVILPDVNDLHAFGEVTLFDCLFTEQR